MKNARTFKRGYFICGSLQTFTNRFYHAALCFWFFTVKCFSLGLLMAFDYADHVRVTSFGFQSAYNPFTLSSHRVDDLFSDQWLEKISSSCITLIHTPILPMRQLIILLFAKPCFALKTPFLTTPSIQYIASSNVVFLNKQKHKNKLRMRKYLDMYY